jgi:hypothetical protein
MFWNSRKKGNFSYESAGAMLSPAELSFYQVVSAAVGKSALLFCKVSMASIIRPHHELSDSRWRKFSREIESQQLEFVLIDAGSLEPLCVLEFEDSSQVDDERQAHQKFIHGVCEAASIPWVMVDARGGFAINDIRQQLAFFMVSRERWSHCIRGGCASGHGGEPCSTCGTRNAGNVIRRRYLVFIR